MKVQWFYVGEDIQIQIEKEVDDYGFDLQLFFELLEDLITCNEVNPNKNTIYLCYDGMVYELQTEDMDKGNVFKAYYIGELVNLLNYKKKSHIDFGKWYWSVDSVEEFPK